MSHAHDRVAAIKNIRAELGCGLREAHDFYMSDPSTADTRLAVQLAKTKQGGSYYVSPEEKIRDAINRYYLALDRRQHGGAAQEAAFWEIQEILGMSWKQGEQLKKQEGANAS